MSLSAANSRPRIPLGMGGMISGTVSYGGFAARGAKRMKQYQEQTDGLRPSLTYRGAEFLPAVALDTNMDGAPVVMFAGSIVAPAGIAGVGPVAHSLALATGGVDVKLRYDNISIGAVENIDNLGHTVAVAATQTVAALAANKPIGVASVNVYSAATEKLFRNLKLQHELPYICDWLVEFPVFNKFMAGGTIAHDAVLDRSAVGLADLTLNLDSDVTLDGIQGGDIVVVNPYLPGTLISSSDLEKLINVDPAMRTALGSGVVVATETEDGAGVVTAQTFALSARHMADQKVGKVMKRQTIMTIKNEAGSTVVTARDAYAEGLYRVTTAKGFGLSGNDSQGVEAHLASAWDYALTLIPANGNEASVATIYVNLQF